jgi:hypothetical protein
MPRQRQRRQRMIIPGQPDGYLVANLVHQLDGRAGRRQGKAVASQYRFVAAGVEVVEAAAELELLAGDGEGAEGGGSRAAHGGGQGVGVDAQEPAHAGALQLQEAGGAVVGVQVHGILLDVAEDPLQHIKKVDADVGGDAARFLDVALPAGVVPVAAGGEVGEVYVELGVGRRGGDPLAQGDHAGVQAQLQDVVRLVAGFLGDLLQDVHVPGVQHQGLLADDVGAVAEAEADVGVVQVVGRADAQEVDALAAALDLLEVAVEALELHEEVGLGKVAVQYAHRIVGVQGGQQQVAGVPDGLQVARGYVATGAGEGEGFYGVVVLSI